MIVDAKCNIISLALEKVKELYWGTNSGVDRDIVRNYMYSLDCSSPSACHIDSCQESVVVFRCDLSIAKISYTKNENQIVFFIADEDLVGGKVPYEYKWTYEQNDFDNSGVINVEEARLTVKVGKKLDLLVTKIQVEVTDTNNCKYTKICYLTPTGIQCADNYIPCPNVSGLVVTSKTIRCVGVSGLIVSKKL